MKLETIAEKNFEYMKKIRKKIHATPEVGLETYQTTKIITSELELLGVEYELLGSKKTGIVADIIKGEKYCLGFRADTDAIVMIEENKHSFASKNNNMHSCGHDANTAILLGTVKSVIESNLFFNGTLRFIFQPGEEGYFGAKDMIDAGLLKRKPFMQGLIGIHLNPDYPYDSLATQKGYMTANIKLIDVSFYGKEFHQLRPDLGSDAMYALAEFMTQAQSMIGRMRNPMKPLVFSYLDITHESNKHQVPHKVRLRSSLRYFDNEIYENFKENISNLSEGLKKTYGVDCKMNFHEDLDVYPAVINDNNLTEKIHKIIKKNNLKLKDNSVSFLGVDDFGFFSEKIPSCFTLIGTYSEKQKPVSLHNPYFDFDERALITGNKYLLSVINDFDKF